MDTTTKFYQDGTVRVWNVYRQQWQCAGAVEDISDDVWSAIPREERDAAIAFLDHETTPEGFEVE